MIHKRAGMTGEMEVVTVCPSDRQGSFSGDIFSFKWSVNCYLKERFKEPTSCCAECCFL